jgi:hypothetical protein
LLDKQQAAGEYEMRWTPENLPDGVYYYSLTTEYSVISNKIIYRE